MKYDGIKREMLFLLAENRFQDSRDFYEQHKEELKQGITVPMRQIAQIIGEDLIKLDPMMNTIPTKMVSRIFRDSRYTKDKHHYRENMWIMFMRDKHEWVNYPCFWFEIMPTGYSMGIGFYGNEPGLMRTFREHIRENPSEFKKFCKKCENAGGVLFGDRYKRIQEGCPDGLEEYYNSKNFGFISFSYDMDDLADEGIIEIIRDNYNQFAPMYKFLLDVSDDYFAKGEE